MMDSILRTLVYIFFASISIMNISGQIQNCDIHDTVNITDSELLSNGSRLYKGISIPPELMGIYEHEIYGGVLYPAESHLRGCVCKLRSCMKFCCEPGFTGEPGSWECLQFDYENSTIYVNITSESGDQKSLTIDEFEIQIDVPCLDSYSLVPQKNSDHEWKLFENATLVLSKLNKNASKNEYCLNPQKSYNGNTYMVPMHCKPPSFPIGFYVNNILMCISVPFLLMAAIVYLSVPSLRRLHGKCLISYFFALIIGYGCLVILNFNPDISNGLCRLMGYSAYFGFLAAFTWLSVISFDMCYIIINNKSGRNRQSPIKTFLQYCLCAWGIPASMTCIAIFIQYFTNIPTEWKPRIGSVEFCWLPTNGWCPMLYFYGPMLIFMLFNLIIFICTTHQIRSSKKNVKTYGTTHSKKHRALFIRLFILMGLTWLLEIGSYLVGNDSAWSVIFVPADLLNSTQGIVVFYFAVCSKSSRMEVIKRFRPISVNSQRISTRTQTTTLSERMSSTASGPKTPSFRM